MTSKQCLSKLCGGDAGVQAGGSGTYSAADIDAATGNDGLGFFGGWALVIVTQDPGQPSAKPDGL